MKKIVVSLVLLIVLVLGSSGVALAHHNTIWQNASCTAYDFGAQYYGGSELRRVVWNVSATVDGVTEAISGSWEGRSPGFQIFQRTAPGAHTVDVTGWVKMYERDWSLFGGWHWDLVETDTFNLHFSKTQCHSYDAYTLPDQKCDEGWWVSAIITDYGVPIDNFIVASGLWENQYATETIPATSYEITLPDETVVTRPAAAIVEGTDCQEPHETSYYFKSDCDTYSAGYWLDGAKVETVSGVWVDQYGPEKQTVTVVVPENTDELYPDGAEFVFDIAKDVSCIQCKMEKVYPMMAYMDSGAPDNYWNGGECRIIHQVGVVPSADVVTKRCSLCPKQTADGLGYTYHGTNAFYDGWLYKVTCYGREPYYVYNGQIVPIEQVRSNDFNQEGERIGGCYTGCDQ